MAVLGIGTAPTIPGYGLGNSSTYVDEDLMRYAVQQGFTYIDTAIEYGFHLLPGLAPVLAKHNVHVCAKLGTDKLIYAHRWLKGTPVNTVLVHNATPEFITSPLAHILVAGIANLYTVAPHFTGVSTYGVKHALAAAQTAWCHTIQVEHSILNQSVVPALLPHVQDRQIVARSVLCKGLLTERRAHLKQIQPQVKAKLAGLEQLAHAWGYTLPVLAVRFALQTPGVHVVLVGISNQQEVDTAIHALKANPLTPQQYTQLTEFDCSEFDQAHPERW